MRTAPSEFNRFSKASKAVVRILNKLSISPTVLLLSTIRICFYESRSRKNQMYGFFQGLHEVR